ncbi:MAG: ATP-dependent Clp protease adapter ClpS [Desulfobacterales bacterium]|nr:ATP-dependent Clp protease adapter ClpS [Desulfobacterales bacterium]
MNHPWRAASAGSLAGCRLEGDVRSGQESQLDEPPLYKVLLLNDDYTTMDFVVEVLKQVFHKSDGDAHRIMLNVHRNGFGVCGLYPRQIAETKIDMVDSLSREKGFPLKCTMERD